MQINDSGIVTTGNTATGTSDLKTTYTITSTKHQVVGSSGNRYARFTITDKAGNTVTKNIRIYIDLGAPTLVSSSLSPRFESSTTITYKCTDEMSGFASFGTKTLSKTYTKNVTSSNSPVTVQCKDTAGNTSSDTRTYTWSAISDCGVSYYQENCWYEQKYLGIDSDYACENSGNVCKGSPGGTKCYCYTKDKIVKKCGEETPVYKTCWHQ